MTLRVALAATLFGFAAADLSADDYTVDNAHTSVIFSVKHLNLSYIFGRFNKVSGKYTLDAAKPEASTFEVAIDVNSIDTNNAQRDAHLKNADFFNAGEFPVITFKSIKVAARQEGETTTYDVTGDMTMHGVTKPVTFKLEKVGEGQAPGPMGYRSGFVCAAKIKRSDFGMSNMLNMVGDDVTVNIGVEGVRQGGAAAPSP
jgi:polyisoprenoid-binding protein YceI